MDILGAGRRAPELQVCCLPGRCWASGRRGLNSGFWVALGPQPRGLSGFSVGFWGVLGVFGVWGLGLDVIIFFLFFLWVLGRVCGLRGLKNTGEPLRPQAFD